MKYSYVFHIIFYRRKQVGMTVRYFHVSIKRIKTPKLLRVRRNTAITSHERTNYLDHFVEQFDSVIQN